MRKRDLDILASLDKFKVLTSNQLAVLHFSSNSNPTQSCNRVLKRLRTSGYIQANTDRAFHPYLYFLNPSPIKTNSQKIDHYLLIAQTYIDMKKYADVQQFLLERKLEHADFIPDAFVDWLGKKWFVECQNSLYTTNQLYNKLDKYVRFYEKGYMDPFPNVLIIGKQNLLFKDKSYPFIVRQIQSMDDLKESIDKMKKRQSAIQINSGTIKLKV